MVRGDLDRPLTAVEDTTCAANFGPPTEAEKQTLPSAEWEKAWCKGGKFSQALIRSEDQAAAYVTPVRSPWDGNLIQQFRT